MLAHGADLSICMEGNGWSPLFVASWAGKDLVVAELLAASADASTRSAQLHLEVSAGATSLYVASKLGRVKCVKLLATHAPELVDMADDDGATPVDMGTTDPLPTSNTYTH